MYHLPLSIVFFYNLKIIYIIHIYNEDNVDDIIFFKDLNAWHSIVIMIFEIISINKILKPFAWTL